MVVLDLPALPAQDFIDELDDLEKSHKAAFDQQDTHQSMVETTTSSSVSPVILKSRQVSLEQAQTWLQTFRRMSLWFPFVTIPPDATVPSLARDVPFVLLSLLTVTAKSDTNYYYQLDHEFRRVLSHQVVVEGR